MLINNLLILFLLLNNYLFHINNDIIVGGYTQEDSCPVNLNSNLIDNISNKFKINTENIKLIKCYTQLVNGINIKLIYESNENNIKKYIRVIIYSLFDNKINEITELTMSKDLNKLINE